MSASHFDRASWTGDDSGIYLAKGVGLRNRRLAVVDLFVRGQKPMSIDDATIWTTCNCEIYKHREIRSELETNGVCFRPDCDTEVILRAYES